MTQYIKRLPAVFQTTTQKQFFDATFDQVFTKKDSSFLQGYLGRRNPGAYNPISDFYIPEPTKNRTWWQLEATAYSEDANSNKTNIFFYEDLLNRINYYNGNTLNQDRLFESEYYSFGPPIDYDMFINYTNYYWVESGLPSINIAGVMASDIIGKSSYTTPLTATPPNLTLTTGMNIILTSDPAYSNSTYTVENIGGCIGIRLVSQFSDFTIGTVFEFLPWDASITLSTGRVIDNSHWDENTWDTQTQPTNGDYITIQRGSLDRNSWSRTNKWFHIDTINQVSQLTGSSFPPNANRALRPIIQFVADLELYNSGTQFRQEITYGLTTNANGVPYLLSSFQGQSINTLNTTYSMTLADGNLVSFFNDTTPIVGGQTNSFIWKLTNIGGIAVFSEYTSTTTPVINGDIVFIDVTGPGNSALEGSTWYYENGAWQEAFNDKIGVNQPPLFQLYDHNGVALNDPTTYPGSLFEGSQIFSYLVNPTPGATPDPILGFPIVYTSLGQASDIIFENNLITNRYTYGSFLPINGYYYYNITSDVVMYNNWNLYDICSCNSIVPPPPANCLEVSKQRVIDQFVVGYGTLYQFALSVTPYGYPTSPDIIVSVNGTELSSSQYTMYTLNNQVYVDLTTYLTQLFTVTQTVAPVVQIETYSQALLDSTASGYFEIPQQLESNPTQQEIGQISGSDLIQQFSSIISNQIGFTGTAYGGPNNYRDSRKNRSLGQYILQNVCPILKSMLISQDDSLDFIQAIRFSTDEYTKFKSKYLNVGLQLINQEFSPSQYYNNSVVIAPWVDKILKTINISTEFSNAFSLSYMVASGTPSYSETQIVSGDALVTLANYIDLSNPANVMYVYDATDSTAPLMLLVGEDYTVTNTNLVIDVQMNFSDNDYAITSITGTGSNVIVNYSGPALIVGQSVTISGVTGQTAYNGTFVVTATGIGTVTFTSSVVGIGNITHANIEALKTFVYYLYQNPLPTYIPSTPTKLGMYPTYIPRIELDESFVNPTNVVIGHDGSKTIAFGDYRDALLLELERRIYNGIQSKFRNEYFVPLRVESVKSGFYRQTRYARSEYLAITQSYLNKWCSKYRASYGTNNWLVDSQTTPVNELWKLYNYRDAVTPAGQPLNLPGNWKGIFQYYYDTFYPDTRPWEMLGFSEQPSWWVQEYGSSILNGFGQEVWTSTSAGLNNMYSDLEAGIIRQGPTAIFDPYTMQPQPQPMWARPGLASVIPVDASGNIIPVPTLFNVALSGNPYEPYDGFDNDWIYGDGSPVEQTWMSTSSYAFNIQEFLYLMRPGPFGELMWDTLGTEVSPGQLTYAGIEDPVLSDSNWQYVQNDVYQSTNAAGVNDSFFAWMRPKNADQYVQGEVVNGITQLRFGYQSWITDRIFFLGSDVGTTFGQKIRTLDVNLANKFAGFTNQTTANIYIQSVTPGATTSTLIVPSTNFDVILHKGPPIATYVYSGVIIRALVDGTFVVYGYDLLNSSFTILDRTTDQLINITVGGTPAPFEYYENGSTYAAGTIVRYNGIYYESLGTQTVNTFNAGSWQKLSGLPTVGGVSVVYKPVSASTTTVVPYGTILNTVQEVFDFMIGLGAYQAQNGWQFTYVDPNTSMVSDWLYSAKQFLFWLNTNWAPDASIQLSPLANQAELIITAGYPDDVEEQTNGIYNILDKYGVAISPKDTTVERQSGSIIVSPENLSAGGIYFLQITASETEHILIFDNETSFSDIIYDPLLGVRQERLQFGGFRSNGWYGKMEAPGYLIIAGELVPNYDTIVDSMRYYYDPNTPIDNPSLEALGRHLIGYDQQSYFANLQMSDDVQYLFYQGAIRQKGTSQAIENLFRSTAVQSNEVIEIYEEWALKLGEFGNTIEQVSTEFILQPEVNTGQVIIARLNFVPNPVGSVKSVKILNAQDTYTTVPAIIIDAPDAQPPANTWTIFNPLASYVPGQVVRYNDVKGNAVYYSCVIPVTPGPFNASFWSVILATRNATAYAVLANNMISRIDMIDPGYGYTKAPNVSISSGSQPNNLDRLYSVWEGGFTVNNNRDNIVDISISDSDIWTVRPEDPSYSLVFPTTPNIVYEPIPNAGYVNFNDVTLSTFNVTTAEASWGTNVFNPIENNTIWIANTFTSDWDVYKMVNVTTLLGSGCTFQIQPDSSGNLYLLVPTAYTLSVQGGTDSSVNAVTDFGNMLSFQIIEATAAAVVAAGTITAIDLVGVGAGYTSVPTVTITGTGTGASATAVLAPNGTISSITLNSGGTGYGVTGTIITISAPYANPLTVSTSGNFIVGLGPIDQAQHVADPTNNYYEIVDINGVQLTSTDLPSYASFTKLMLFKTMRFWQAGAWPANQPVTLPSYMVSGDKIWVDQVTVGVENLWTVYTLPLASPALPFRQQAPLIDTSLFQSATVFNTSGTMLVQLPIFDPFKSILPGPARQNITYMSTVDPASYNVTNNPSLFSENITFNDAQVGQLWWDISTAKYVYYEQPIALDGSETETDNLVYRRNNWGQLFAGSVINIYEWVQSTVPPASYAGTGTPKDTNSYVQITSVDLFTSTPTTYYYFWVSGATDQPNLPDRTLAAVDVALILQSPASQAFAFFCPIQQTATNNSYMFYNVQNILAYQGNNVQIQYRTAQRDDQKHAQWMFFREGDTGSLVTDQYWNKMVDSLAGYTALLAPSDEYKNALIIADDLPWDLYGWDIAPWDDATATTTPEYGIILPVPDPTLSPVEQLGIQYRPLQTMFYNLLGARKVFTQASNALLQYIPIRDNTPSWYINADLLNYENVYWQYTNSLTVGYETATPTVVYQTLADANNALVAGQLIVGTIVQVVNGTSDGRYILYVVVQSNVSSSILSLEQITIQNSAIQIMDSVYTTTNMYGLSLMLREMLNAFRTTIFINGYIVDQNELYFSMLNYVLSENKNPDWVFKSSYIYLKENNLPLSQTQLYIPDTIDNVINYITDAKPYHTQVRDYTSTYTTTDIAAGTASDSYILNLKLAFGPNTAGTPITVPTYTLDASTFANNVQQFISQEQVYTVPLTTLDASKVGFSTLYPYTFSFDSIDLNNPQTFFPPTDIVGVQIGTKILIYGQDYYAEFNADVNNTYTVYFYNDPGTSPVPVALVWYDGGQLLQMTEYTPNAEIAQGYPVDDMVVNVDTKLAVNNIAGTYSAFNDMWDSFDPVINGIVVGSGGEPMGFGNSFWDQNTLADAQLLDNTISFKENTNPAIGAEFYRNGATLSGTVYTEILAPTADTYNIQSVILTATSDIIPNTSINANPAPAIWIGGERIEYKKKTQLAPGIWQLSLLRRGTMGTSAQDHAVGKTFWVEAGNVMAVGANSDVWNAVDLPAVPVNVFQISSIFGNGTSMVVNYSGPLIPVGTSITISGVAVTTAYNGTFVVDTSGVNTLTCLTSVVGTADVTNATITATLSEYDNITAVPLGGLWYAQTPEAIYLKANQGISIP